MSSSESSPATGFSRALTAYMWTVVLLAAPTVGWALYSALPSYQGRMSGSLFGIEFVIVAVVIAGELRPIPVSRGLESGDEITISTAFGFALLLIAPLFTVIAAQSVGLIIDCILHKSLRKKLLFNIAQYALAYFAARAVYCAIARLPFTPPPTIGPPSIWAGLIAGLAFLLVNNFLVAVAVAVSLHVRMHLARVLVGDLTWQITTSAPLIGLGPLAVVATQWTPFALGLLLMPVAALYHTGTMAMRHEQDALRDGLTGLGNRTMLATTTTRALAEVVGQTAMLLLDLDHFKDINDTLGHAVGDQMLIAVSQRLRTEAGPDHFIARLGGDEFVVLARGVDNQADAVSLAERLCSAVRRPVVLEGVTLTVGCSVGIAFGPEQAGTVSELLRCADVALYNAKSSRGTAAVYDKGADWHSTEQLRLHADLRMALEDEDDLQLWVAFQPQLDMAAGEVTSVECLTRWHHPELGNIAPDVFVPIAESTSLIDLLLDRVLNTALVQLREWDETGLHLAASVNLSARQLTDITLPETVRRCLSRHGIAPSRLILEVTESRLLSNPGLSAQTVDDLHALGVQISIDDFGTGYSSFAHLQRLAVNELKIDKSFTTSLDATNNAAIVQSAIDLGHNLGLRVVAEGVETVEVADQLTRMGCDVLQGYLIGRPVPASEIPNLAARAARELAAADAQVVDLMTSGRAASRASFKRAL